LPQGLKKPPVNDFPIRLLDDDSLTMEQFAASLCPSREGGADEKLFVESGGSRYQAA
jgi:hypothetical protein